MYHSISALYLLQKKYKSADLLGVVHEIKKP